jgi:hypothetical protein
MPWYNVYVTLKGPGSVVMDVPNTGNPVQADGIGDVLRRLALPDFGQLGVEITAVRVHAVPDADDGAAEG